MRYLNVPPLLAEWEADVIARLVAVLLSAWIGFLPAKTFAQAADTAGILSEMPQIQKDRVTGLLRDYGLLKPDEDLGRLTPQPLANPWCVTACNVAAAAAAQHCGGDQACLIAVELARQLCVSQC
jgi:hypothetical protein